MGTNYKCCICGKAGYLELEEAISNDAQLLAEYDDGLHYCMPCFLREFSHCLHCSKEADLFPDTTCNAEPWLCEECLNLPYRIHMFSCYQDGCMSPSEFAEECQRGLEDEEEESEYGYYSWGSGETE